MDREEGRIACIDMEFGHVYGTHRNVVMPIEVGAVVYGRDDEMPVFAGRTFAYDIEVEVWQNRIGPLGVRTGVETSVANPGKGLEGRPYDPSHRLGGRGWRRAREVAAASFTDLGDFMRDLCDEEDISRFAFFARGMETKALARAGFDLSGYRCTDLQHEVRAALGMRDVLSLDRASCIIDFAHTQGEILSRHYRYPVPEVYDGRISPHTAVGDASRIFLLAREFYAEKDGFLTAAGEYFSECAAVAAKNPQGQ
ncbi:hypothetical protein [Methanofollis sp. UBA420]|jgi:hypothetical protein|uniref:hypothetical protein n=1 Tax=Methanofollis sp. UBA420 TaxID=1915514 RepID=UPI00316ADF67